MSLFGLFKKQTKKQNHFIISGEEAERMRAAIAKMDDGIREDRLAEELSPMSKTAALERAEKEMDELEIEAEFIADRADAMRRVIDLLEQSVDPNESNRIKRVLADHEDPRRWAKIFSIVDGEYDEDDWGDWCDDDDD